MVLRARMVHSITQIIIVGCAARLSVGDSERPEPSIMQANVKDVAENWGPSGANHPIPNALRGRRFSTGEVLDRLTPPMDSYPFSQIFALQRTSSLMKYTLATCGLPLHPGRMSGSARALGDASRRRPSLS